MTRGSFLLTLPIISFLNRDKIFDHEYECKIRDQLYHNVPIEPYTDKWGYTRNTFGNGSEVDRYFDQYERVWAFETLYADREWIEDQGTFKINWVPKNITESKFKSDCSAYFK